MLLRGPMPGFLNRRAICLALAVAAMLVAASLAAGPAVAQTDSGRPLPRFVSLNTDEANMRTGPGVRFPIDWVYTRRNLPLEVIAEYDTWRKVRDWDGAEGWMHHALLSARRSVMVTAEMATLRREPSQTAPAVAQLARGMVGLVRRCDQTWCLIEVGRYQGWVRREGLWGLYVDEALN